MDRVVYDIDPQYGKLDNQAIFTKDPRFGFWSLSFARGGIPKELSGQYTSLERLKTKLNIYLSRRQENKASLGARIDDVQMGLEDGSPSKRTSNKR